MRADQRDDILLDMVILQRESLGRIEMKMAAQQLGEAWVGLDDRRRVVTIKRGPPRRKWTEGQPHEVSSPRVGEHIDGDQRHQLHGQSPDLPHEGAE